jgi:hypothetical protein
MLMCFWHHCVQSTSSMLYSFISLRRESEIDRRQRSKPKLYSVLPRSQFSEAVCVLSVCISITHAYTAINEFRFAVHTHNF